MLAALAVEHGLVVMSADTDFARFGEVRWGNSLARGRWSVAELICWSLSIALSSSASALVS